MVRDSSLWGFQDRAAVRPAALGRDPKGISGELALLGPDRAYRGAYRVSPLVGAGHGLHDDVRTFRDESERPER